MHRLDRLLILTAVGTILASLGSFVAASWWVFELNTHFRVQYLITALVLLIGFALRKHRYWPMALIPVMALNAIPLAPYWPRPGEPLSRQESITLMSVNVNARNSDYGPMISMVEAESPDIVLILEFNSGWGAALRELHETYPYRVQVPRNDLFGIALFSRLPFLDERVFQLQGTSAVDIRIASAGRSVRLLGVHLRPPVSTEWAAERNRQLAQLTAMARKDSAPLIALGDFNITPYSPLFTSELAGSGLRDARLSRGWGFSWPTFLPILGIPIDLCMVSGQFIVLDHRHGPAFGSDHNPVMATLALT